MEDVRASRALGLITCGLAALLNVGPAAAEAPYGAVLAETKEQVALLSDRLRKLMKRRALDQRGVWFSAPDGEHAGRLGGDVMDRAYTCSACTMDVGPVEPPTAPEIASLVGTPT